MKRREAIKNLSLGIGYVVSAPVILGVLESCSKQETTAWETVFLSGEQRHMVSHLVDIILPSTDIPGGLDLNLPQFVDKMCEDLLTERDKKRFNEGSKLFANALRSNAGKEVSKSGRRDVLDVFENYFKVSPEKQLEVLQTQEKGDDERAGEQLDQYHLYKFLIVVREFALLGYYSSEQIGKEVLVFDPIPGGYKPCIPLSEVGNAWTIDP